MATSEQYFNPGTALSFKGSGGDVTLTFASAADQSLSVSAQYDRGAGAKPGLYRWFCQTQMNASGTVGRQARIYIVQAQDATDIPGRLGTSDTEIASAGDRLRNLGIPIGVVTADTTSSGTDLIASGTCFIYARYISVAVYNDYGVSLHATEGNHYFTLQPIPPQQQAT